MLFLKDLYVTIECQNEKKTSFELSVRKYIFKAVITHLWEVAKRVHALLPRPKGKTIRVKPQALFG